MDDETRILEMLERALDSGSTPEEVCADCPELLRSVRKQWEQCQRLEAEIDELLPSASDDAIDAPLDPHSLPHIPGYEVEAILGRGGMGIVYKARHLGLNRTIALKMLVSGAYASRLERARFLREAQAVASLRHPAVVQVHDVGEVEGRPFLTMEFVEGKTLADDLAGTPQPAARAAAMLATLADAIESAHRSGIIHRDLKPANILLSADGDPKISDFGLARHFEGEDALTVSGARVGTPSYMSPEQVFGRAGTVGPAADIYALGAILYEMLTGRPPFRGESAAETERQLIAQDPVPPSRLNARVPRDVETICLKCLEKEPGKRYPTAASLAADLGRFLRNEPIHARPLSWVGQTSRWVRRHQGLAAALSGVALLLMLLTFGSLVASAHFRRLERVQATLALETGKLANEKEIERGKAVKAEKREAGLRQQAETQGEEIRRNLYLAEMNRGAQAALSPGGIGRVREHLLPWESMQPDLRDWEWYYLNSLCHRDLLTLRTETQGVMCVAWSPDGRKLASAGADRILGIWDAADGREIFHLSGHWASICCVAWSPDGKRVASASWDHTVRTWNAVTGAPLLTLPVPAANVNSVAWSPDGTRLAFGDAQGAIGVCNADTGANIHVLHGHKDAVFGIAWSPDGSRLASAGVDATVRLWDPVAGKEAATLRGHGNWVRMVAWNRDGRPVGFGQQ
jgi:tRNA A-37 threonylcarbamoyl transferase component Bud32